MKRRRIAIIIYAVLLFVGVVFLVTGRVMQHSSSKAKPENLNPFVLKDLDIGKRYVAKHIDFLDGGGNNKDTPYSDVCCIRFMRSTFDSSVEPDSEEDVASYVFIEADFPTAKKIYQLSLNDLADINNYVGKISKLDDTEFARRKNALRSYFADYFQRTMGVMDYGDKTVDELVDDTLETLTPYCWTPEVQKENYSFYFLAGGMLLILISGSLLVCVLIKVRKRFFVPITILVILIALGALLFKHMRSAFSVKEIAPGFYSIANYACDDTAELLEANVRSVEDMVTWITNNDFYGLPIEFGGDTFGCSSFTAASPEGERLFGRNFDYRECDALLVYTDPREGYASIGMTDLDLLGIGSKQKVKPTDPLARILMTAAPYVLMDGINEAGVGVSILELRLPELHQDTGNPDLLIYCALRGILDSCGSVDEALELLRSHDIHSSLGVSYHLFITDLSGRSVVVEWLDNEMHVTEASEVTNCVLLPGEHYGKGSIDDRLSDIISNLEGHSYVVTAEEAMSVLAEANQPTTEWSAVYNLSDFSVDICVDNAYGEVRHFEGRGQ